MANPQPPQPQMPGSEEEINKVQIVSSVIERGNMKLDQHILFAIPADIGNKYIDQVQNMPPICVFTVADIPGVSQEILDEVGAPNGLVFGFVETLGGFSLENAIINMENIMAVVKKYKDQGKRMILANYVHSANLSEGIQPDFVVEFMNQEGVLIKFDCIENVGPFLETGVSVGNRLFGKRKHRIMEEVDKAFLKKHNIERNIYVFNFKELVSGLNKVHKYIGVGLQQLGAVIDTTLKGRVYYDRQRSGNDRPSLPKKPSEA